MGIDDFQPGQQLYSEARNAMTKKIHLAMDALGMDRT